MEGDIKRARERVTVAPSRPCVFVSHRRSDGALARRVAFLACKEGFDFWLDVVDPNLYSVTGVTLSSEGAKAAAIAAIIEMALLNSTHVVAVMTANTKGSEWVPYQPVAKVDDSGSTKSIEFRTLDSHGTSVPALV